MSGLVSIIAVAALAAAPISELRGAIPIGIHTFHLDPAVVVAAAIFGNMVPAFLIIYFLEPFMRWLGRYIPVVHRFVDVYLVRSRKKVQLQIDKYGTIGLMIFIGIPLPMTGVWTGAAAAVLLGLRKKNAILACLGGVVMAAALIYLLDFGVVSFIKILIK